jgi:heme/copper-type cytochrome/quinol oxidase subunit 2
MRIPINIICLYIITIIVIIIVLYSIFNKKNNSKTPSIINRSQVFETHWWGYGWRPGWRRRRNDTTTIKI